MNDVRIAVGYLAQKISHRNQHDDDHEDEQVGVAEDEDELRDGIVGDDTGQQTGLVCPTKLILLGGQLYPYGVFCVLGNDAYVGNDQQTVLPDGKGVDAQMVDILLRLLMYQHE